VLQLGFNLRDSGAETALDLGDACASADVPRLIKVLKISAKLSQQFFRRSAVHGKKLLHKIRGNRSNSYLESDNGNEIRKLVIHGRPGFVPECGEKNQRVNRLGENLEAVAFPVRCLQNLRRVVMARHQQDAALGLKFANGNRGIYAVHSAHHNIADEESKLLRPCSFDSLFAAITDRGLKAANLEDHSEGVGDGVFVVNHKNLGPILSVHD
jgi:hypothetical protein